jgi:CcmD family protein
MRLLSMLWLAFQPAAQGEFVPIDQLPPADQLPAAPLLVAAYAFVWLVLMFYLWSIWRRLKRVEADMGALERGRQQRGSAR